MVVKVILVEGWYIEKIIGIVIDFVDYGVEMLVVEVVGFSM